MSETIEIEKPTGPAGLMAFAFANLVIYIERWLTASGGDSD